jgi:hypothetical protein
MNVAPDLDVRSGVVANAMPAERESF